MLAYQNSRKFQTKVLNFPEEVYRINDSSTHIFKYMYTLLQIGVGQLELWQDEAQNSESLPGTKYTDLDALYAFLGITRLPEEIYPFDPYHDQLTSDQWNQIFTKDSLFRMRIMKFFQAMLRGGTLEGIQMMAEAASGVECQVFEMWRVLNGRGLAEGTALGRRDANGDLLLEIAKEFIIIPYEDISDNQRAAIIHLVELLKPVNTVCTVHDSPILPLQEVVVRFSASEDHYFEIHRMVTASDNPTFVASEIWVQPNQEVEAPTFAGMSHHDAEFSLNEAVTSIKTFSIDDQFLVDFGTLSAAIVSTTADTITVTETSQPAAPAFSIKVDDEEMFVTDRTPVFTSDTDYTYTVLRGQNGTIAATHLINALAYLGVQAIYADQVPDGSTFGPWRLIPLADSPDNYSTGKFAGDPSKYDAEGNYIFEYSSQMQFISYYTVQIQQIGGEVSGTQYRLPIAIETVGGLVSYPEDVLAPPEFSIQVRIYPERQ
jgi:hypothetical protein